ncbi:MAG: hypothetical protein ACYTGC_03755 [Planctomycetota bacterium]
MPDDQTPPPATDRGEARAIYRDDEEFNSSLDKAAESIRKAAGPNVLGNAIWCGLVGLQVFLYATDKLLGWDLRTQLVPGVDLVKPLWIVIIGLIVWDHVWRRQQHARIIGKRLCFQCGASQADTPVDEHGDGTCPGCGRAFNLGEYRRPAENRGAGFSGYLDPEHFDKALYKAAERIRSARGFGLESNLLGWAWIALGVCFGASVLLGWDVLDWVPTDLHVYGVWFVGLLVWSGFYSWRLQRMRPSIVAKHLCFDCGFSLVGTPTDEQGIGRCSECGALFVLAQYVRPEEELEEEQ